MDYTSGSRPSAELSTAAMAYLTDLQKELHSALRAGICTPFRPFRSIAAGWPPVWVQFNQNANFCKGGLVENASHRETHFIIVPSTPVSDQCIVDVMLFYEAIRPADDSKFPDAGDADAVEAMNDQEVSSLVPSPDNPNMADVRGKDKIAGLGLVP